MFVTKSALDLFHISRDTVDDLRKQNAVLISEVQSLKLQAAVDRTHTDWLRVKVNQLELERAGLIEKAYSIKLPAIPEISRPTQLTPMQQFGFDDIGDEVAKRLGIPVWTPPTPTDE